MNNMEAGSPEQQWRTLLRRNRIGEAPVLSICGPSAVGKTTVVKALAVDYPAFIETTDGNPYLRDLLHGSEVFDATGNQEWFLHRIGDHVADADPRLPLVLDQEPGAIVFAYARMFRDESRITNENWTRLTRELLRLEAQLSRWSCPRVVLVLDAPPEVLHARALQRSGADRTPPITWFVRLREHFQEFSQRLPNKLVLSTAGCKPTDVVTQARRLLERAMSEN